MDAVYLCTESVFTPQYISVTGDSLSTVEVYDPIVGRWQLAEAMSMLRSRVGVAVMRNRLYAFGGYNGCERLSTVEVFDPQKRAWSRVSPMHSKRRLVHSVDVIKFHWLVSEFQISSAVWLWTHECKQILIQVFSLGQQLVSVNWGTIEMEEILLNCHNCIGTTNQGNNNLA
jgi:hypothetical protein